MRVRMAASVGKNAASAADLLLRVAANHPEFVSGRIVEGPRGPEAQIDLRVEMPLHMKDAGISDSGVRTVEPVRFRPTARFPWQAPRVRLRDDFPRNFPHLLPGRPGQAPSPCLIEGDPDEFFLQFGLVEYGMFHLIEQAASWLRRAALNDLNDPAQGWEPMLRASLSNVIQLDAAAARALVKGKAGWAIWKASAFRRGATDTQLGDGATAYLESDGQQTPLLVTSDNDLFNISSKNGEDILATSVVGIVWPDKRPDGSVPVVNRYWPEDVATLGDLRRRAGDLGCARGLTTFLESVERSLKQWKLRRPIPIGIVLCVHRPFHLVGSDTDIELLPYVIDVRAPEGHTTVFAAGEDEPVAPAQHVQTLTAGLLRSVAGLAERPSIAVLGCGSVGSKLAMHAARSGQPIAALSDHAVMRPHNAARHALGGKSVGWFKARKLAEEIEALGQSPQVYMEDLLVGLANTKTREIILPRKATAIVNSTASLTVREALIEAASERRRARTYEVGLFGRGRVSYLLASGPGNNPNPADLMATMYAEVDDAATRALMFDPEEGLTQLQIGQGCASLTMQMEDARLSMMTAGLSLELGRAMDKPSKVGTILIGTMADTAPAVAWKSLNIDPFEIVPIAGSDGWTLRLSSAVAARIRSEARAHATVETGGLMIGLSSARLRTVTVVGLIDAPPDSERTPNLFVLGTQGLHQSILARHLESGQTLFDVGTWHSHLADEGPSGTDWATAATLAAGRAPPSVLLIVTPKRFHALAGTNGGKKGG